MLSKQNDAFLYLNYLTCGVTQKKLIINMNYCCKVYLYIFSKNATSNHLDSIYQLYIILNKNIEHLLEYQKTKNNSCY